MQAAYEVSIKDNYAKLGWLLNLYRPDLATELLQLDQQNKPVTEDLSIIDLYFQSFLQHTSSEDRNQRKLFIAVAIYLTCPVLFSRNNTFRIPRTGLHSKLCQVLNINEGNMSREMRSVIVWFRQYDDFKDQVLTTASFLQEERKTA